MSKLLRITALVLAVAAGPRALTAWCPAGVAAGVAGDRGVVQPGDPSLGATLSEDHFGGLDNGDAGSDRQQGTRPRGGRRRSHVLTTRPGSATIAVLAPPASQPAAAGEPTRTAQAVVLGLPPDAPPLV